MNELYRRTILAAAESSPLFPATPVEAGTRRKAAARGRVWLADPVHAAVRLPALAGRGQSLFSTAIRLARMPMEGKPANKTACNRSSDSLKFGCSLA